MNRKEAVELLPIIKAYAEGKEIEIFDKTTKMWRTAMLPHFDCDTKKLSHQARERVPSIQGRRRVLAGDAKASTVWVGER